MEKFFKALLIPAKWILVIGSFVYAAWFAVHSAGSINGTFMSVVTNLLILIVGSALLFSVPVLILLKKEDMAKIAFFILAGYWLISTVVERMFVFAVQYTELSYDGLAITAGIFAFIAGLCLVGVLALIVLEFVIKKPILRLFTFFAMAGVILFVFIAGLLLFIFHASNGNPFGWAYTANLLVEYLLVPTIVCFGCLYFLGVPATKKGE